MDEQLGPREREIMEIVYRRGVVSAEDVRAEVRDPVSNAGVRGMLRILEDKRLLTHSQDGPRYLYRATEDRANVAKSAMKKLVNTFYDNSAGSAVIAMLGMFDKTLSDVELDRIESLLRDKRNGPRT